MEGKWLVYVAIISGGMTIIGIIIGWAVSFQLNLDHSGYFLSDGLCIIKPSKEILYINIRTYNKFKRITYTC